MSEPTVKRRENSRDKWRVEVTRHEVDFNTGTLAVDITLPSRGFFFIGSDNNEHFCFYVKANNPGAARVLAASLKAAAELLESKT